MLLKGGVATPSNPSPGSASVIWAILACVAPKDLIFERFWSKKGIDCGHFGLKWGIFHSGLTGCFVYKVLVFGSIDFSLRSEIGYRKLQIWFEIG